MTKMTRRMLLITPEMAASMLSRSRGNRNTSAPVVTALRGAIRGVLGAVWYPSLEPLIAFAGEAMDSDLLNGHHRLTAIKLEGVAVMCEIIENMPLEMAGHLDRARQRSGCDDMRMAHGDILAYARRPILRTLMIVADVNRFRGLSAERYKILLDAIGAEDVDRAIRAPTGRNAILRAAFVYCIPALGGKATAVWDQICSRDMPPEASTIYKILSVPGTGACQANIRPSFAKLVNGFHLISRGKTGAGKLSISAESLGWADAARKMNLTEIGQLLRETP